MEFSDVVRRRRMVRRYRDEPVDPAAVRRMLDLARRGPSAGFTQGQTFVVVTAAATRARIAAAAREPAYLARGFDAWVSSAPVLVVPCVSAAAYRERYAQPDKAASTPADAWQVPYWWVDGGAATMLLLLAAVDEGLAAGFLSVDGDGVRAVLGIPAEVMPLGLVTIGHPAPDRPSGSLGRGRRPLEDSVRWERWQA